MKFDSSELSDNGASKRNALSKGHQTNPLHVLPFLQFRSRKLSNREATTNIF